MQPQPPPPLDGARAAVTFIGHSTFLIQTAVGNILTDPMYSQRAGPFNRCRPAAGAPAGDRFDDLPPIAIVLLSHNHYDHCDLPTLRRLPRVRSAGGDAARQRRLVASAGIRRIEELDWWQHANDGADADHADAGAALLGAHALRSQSRAVGRLHGRRRWRANLYFAGDTAYAPVFRDIGGGSVRSTSRCCRSAPTSRAGSCRRCT